MIKAREVIMTTLITASGEYATARVIRGQGADVSDIIIKLTNQALLSLRKLVLGVQLKENEFEGKFGYENNISEHHYNQVCKTIANKLFGRKR